MLEGMGIFSVDKTQKKTIDQASITRLCRWLNTFRAFTETKHFYCFTFQQDEQNKIQLKATE